MEMMTVVQTSSLVANLGEQESREVRLNGVLGSWHDLICGNEIIFHPLANPVPH
jgi:hypothetical protein